MTWPTRYSSNQIQYGNGGAPSARVVHGKDMQNLFSFQEMIATYLDQWPITPRQCWTLCVDDALGFMMGWNFFLYVASQILFEVVAVGLVLGCWRDDIPAAAVCAACIVLYALINVATARAYGGTEFWLASGRVVLIFVLVCFAPITKWKLVKRTKVVPLQEVDLVWGAPTIDAYEASFISPPATF